MSLWSWLGLGQQATAAAGETDSVKRIVGELEHLPPERARYLAAFAYLLGRAAHADLDVSSEERAKIELLLSEHSDLPPEQVKLVTGIALEQASLLGATEDFLVAREFGRIASVPQKRQLLECLYAVSCSRGLISAEEDNEIRRVASEILLDRQDFLAIRSRYRDKLTLFQSAEGSSE